MLSGGAGWSQALGDLAQQCFSAGFVAVSGGWCSRLEGREALSTRPPTVGQQVRGLGPPLPSLRS